MGNVGGVVNTEPNWDGEEDGKVLVEEQAPELQEASSVNNGEANSEENQQGGGQLHHQDECTDEDKQF